MMFHNFALVWQRLKDKALFNRTNTTLQSSIGYLYVGLEQMKRNSKSRVLSGSDNSKNTSDSSGSQNSSNSIVCQMLA